MVLWRTTVTIPGFAGKPVLVMDAASAADAEAFVAGSWGKWPEGTTFSTGLNP